MRSNLCDLKHEIQIQTFENERELSDVMEKVNHAGEIKVGQPIPTM